MPCRRSETRQHRAAARHPMGRIIYRVELMAPGWVVNVEGKESSRSFPKKAEAIDHAITEAKKNEPSQVIVHLQDGKIATEWSYGDHPLPPPK